MTSVSTHLRTGMWSSGTTTNINYSNVSEGSDDPKPIIDSLLREIAMKGKLEPESIQ